MLDANAFGAIAKAQDVPWIEMAPGQAWMKALWASAETGTWATLFKWRKGYVAAPHRHYGGAHTYILSGKLQVRGSVLEAGDYCYEPNGAVHGATTTLEDCEYLFICTGPIAMLESEDSEKVIAISSWEYMHAAIAARQQVPAAAQ